MYDDKLSGALYQPDPDRPRHLLTACPVYQTTPLTMLKLPSGASFLIKDETARMRLGSFKALGGVYAVARLIAEKIEAETGTVLTPEDYASEAFRSRASDMTFMCASAGNHGLSVAAGANIFGAKARIHLSAEVPEGFVHRLQAVNAEAVRSGATYEDSLAAANADAEQTGAILLADGSWPGYIHPPSLVMEGYTVIAEEMREAFEQGEHPWPTHVFLQAGVGGLAAAMAYMIRYNWAEQPAITVVEPEAAPCLQASSKAGEPVHVEGPVSNMGRLDCKDPSLLAFDALERCDVEYVTVTDDEASAAVDRLSATGVDSTPSGIAGYAALLNKVAAGEDVERPLVIVSEGVV